MDEQEAESGSGAGEILCTDVNESTFNPHDVVLGKGNGINCLPGNQLFRSIINKYKPLYARTPRNVKGSVAELVINEIASLNPPGRFLEPQPDNKRFREVPRRRALEKTCQALREKKNNVPATQMHPPLESSAIAPLTRKVSSPTSTTPSSQIPSDSPPVFPPHPYLPPYYARYGGYMMQGMHPMVASEPPDPPPDRAVMENESKDGDDADTTDRSRAEGQGAASESIDMDVTAQELLTLKDEEDGDPQPVWPLMDNDVLYGGRGRKHFHRVANQRFLDLIKHSREEYQTSRSKRRVALGIISQWKHQKPPGRFLEQKSEDNKWYEIPQSKILEKACQSLRDLKRERGPGGDKPSNISDSLVDPRSDGSAQQHAMQLQNMHVQPLHSYHPHPLGVFPPHARWMGSYPPYPGLMYGNPFIPMSSHPLFGAPGTACSAESSDYHPPMMYRNSFMPMPGGAFRPSAKNASADDNMKLNGVANVPPPKNMIYYGGDYMPHYPLPPTMPAGAASLLSPNGRNGNLQNMMHGVGYLPSPQPHATEDRRSRALQKDCVSGESSSSDDVKNPSYLPMPENPATPSGNEQEEGSHQHAAAIQRQASIVAKEMNEMVHRASGDNSPPPGLVPFVPAVTPTAMANDSNPTSDQAISTGVPNTYGRKHDSEVDVSRPAAMDISGSNRKPERSVCSHPGDEEKKVVDVADSCRESDTKTAATSSTEMAGTKKQMAQAVLNVETVDEKAIAPGSTSESSWSLEDKRPEKKVRISPEGKSVEQAKDVNEVKSKGLGNGSESIASVEESDGQGTKKRGEGDIEAATLLVNMLG